MLADGDEQRERITQPKAKTLNSLLTEFHTLVMPKQTIKMQRTPGEQRLKNGLTF